MRQIHRVLASRRMRSVPVMVLRTHYHKRKNEIKTEMFMAVPGCIQPAPPEAQQMMPEEYRNENAIVVFCEDVLSTGENKSDSYYMADKILYQGKQYRVVNKQSWVSDQFCRALAVETHE